MHLHLLLNNVLNQWTLVCLGPRISYLYIEITWDYNELIDDLVESRD